MDIRAMALKSLAGPGAAVDLWDEWQHHLRDGRADRAVEVLSDEELVNLLAACPDDLVASPTTRALKQEAMERLHRAQRADRPRPPA